jgi:hypothetical protein
MRWQLYIEEYSPDLTYVEGDKNVVADALSRLDMEDKPRSNESLITEEMCSDWYCYSKEEKTYDSHPLTFQQLETAQSADKHILKIIKMNKSPYQLHDYHGGGKNKTTYLQRWQDSCTNSLTETCD